MRTLFLISVYWVDSMKTITERDFAMPELPEVETVLRGLRGILTGQKIISALIMRDGLRWPFPVRMAERLEGKAVERMRRRSKYILADLSSGETLLIHLGMSGRILVSGTRPGESCESRAMPEKHDHIVIDFESGVRITYNDPRRFGFMDLVASDVADLHPLLATLGPEPLSNGFSQKYLCEMLAGRRSPIKSALLDQRVVAGLGNIYVSEALFRSGISPTRQSGKISNRRIGILVSAIREVLRDAIAAGGSSLRDFRGADGELGYFQHGFDVYGRNGKGCRKTGCPGSIRKITQSGRSSYYCPRCQR